MTHPYLPFLPYALCVLWLLYMLLRRMDPIPVAIMAVALGLVLAILDWLFDLSWDWQSAIVIVFALFIELVLYFEADDPDDAIDTAGA